LLVCKPAGRPYDYMHEQLNLSQPLKSLQTRHISLFKHATGRCMLVQSVLCSHGPDMICIGLHADSWCVGAKHRGHPGSQTAACGRADQNLEGGQTRQACRVLQSLWCDRGVCHVLCCGHISCSGGLIGMAASFLWWPLWGNTIICSVCCAVSDAICLP